MSLLFAIAVPLENFLFKVNRLLDRGNDWLKRDEQERQQL
jgi:hypothetical protein